ncbi:hypothetical protein, partial [Nitratireductor indicus]|uniref:hypothetical protein n=1 Tax=Nitratireductor indicus TaxID=721133 RepID=UPI001AEC2A16
QRHFLSFFDENRTAPRKPFGTRLSPAKNLFPQPLTPQSSLFVTSTRSEETIGEQHLKQTQSNIQNVNIKNKYKMEHNINVGKYSLNNRLSALFLSNYIPFNMHTGVDLDISSRHKGDAWKRSYCDLFTVAQAGGGFKTEIVFWRV